MSSPGQGRAGVAGDGARARPGPGRGAGAGAGLRRLPHRPALPRGRHQRRLPVPARARGGRRRRGGRRGRHRRGARRLRGPQLARRLRPVPGLPQGPALVLLRHPQRHPEDDPRRRHRCSARRWASAPSWRRRWWPPGQCTKVDPAAPATAAGPARLRRDGRASARRSTPATCGRGDSVAVIGCGGVGNAAIAGCRLAGATTVIGVDVDDRKLELGHASSAPPTRSTAAPRTPVEAIRELTGGFGADVVIEAVGRPETYEQAFYARDLAGTVVLVGVPTPDMTHRAADDRRLRPRRCAEVQLVRRLPAQSRDFPMLIDLYLPGPARPRRASCPRRSASATSRRRSRRCTAARSCARWWCSDAGPRREGRHLGHLRARRRRVGGRQQRLAGRRRPRGAGRRRGARRRRRSSPRSATAGSSRWSAPTGTTTTSTPPSRWPRPRTPRSRCTRPTSMLWAQEYGDLQPGPRAGRGQARSRSPAPGWPCCTRRGTRRARCASTHRTSGVVFSGDTLFRGGPGATGRSYSDFPTRSSTRSGTGC